MLWFFSTDEGRTAEREEERVQDTRSKNKLSSSLTFSVTMAIRTKQLH